MNISNRPQLFGLIAGLFLAAGLVFSSFVVTRAWMAISQSQTISVTGSARKNIRADLIIWNGTFSAESPVLLDAQRTLKADLGKVTAFLKGKGVKDYQVSPIAIEEIRVGDRDLQQAKRVASYRLAQTVTVHSSEVDRISQVINDSTVLVEQGVLFVSGAPEFIYTKAGEAKVEMLAEATKDARTRAEQICQQGGRVIDRLLSAKMGVFQITPLYSTETSGEGLSDTKSLDKTVTAIVSARFVMK
ncbi:MAG: SIMPL domain-containing protein [Verrucomicrobia bacterium]|nr:SIMPL domain-containing protein [Verrucomicrobiota bacterium]